MMVYWGQPTGYGACRAGCAKADRLFPNSAEEPFLLIGHGTAVDPEAFGTYRAAFVET